MQLKRPRSTYGAVAGAIALSAAAALGVYPAHAQPVASVDARSGLYIDSDHTQIVTMTVAASGTIKDRVTLSGRYLADIVSSASIDVVSAATPKFDEVRHEASGTVAYADGTRTASLAYVYSTENDWTSHSIQAGASLDFFDHQLTMGAGGSVTFNAVGRSDDANFHRDLTQGSAALNATIVASRNDLLNATYTLIVMNGYQASPYRFAYFTDPSLSGLRVGNPETDPNGRLRHALGLRWNRHVFSDSAVRSQARVYIDDWGVASGTLGLEYVIGFSPIPIEIGLIGRGYAQKKAAFYEPVYETRRRYMTADRELSTFMDAFFGARVGYRGSFASFIKEFRAEIKAEGFIFHYFDYPLLVDRTGLTTEVGIGASF